MVYKKRLEFGFSGYGTLMVPRAPRSMRRKKSGEEEKHCSFELLASVAGKLLQESEGSASSNAAEVKVNLHEENEEIHTIGKTDFKCENVDHGSCDESVFVPETFIQEHNLLPSIKRVHESDIDCDIKLGGKEEKSSKANDMSSGIGHSSINEQLHLKLEHGSEVHSRDVKDQIGDLSVANALTSKDPVEEFVNNNPVVSSESSVKLPLYRELFPCGLLQKHWSNVKVGITDDGENFSGSKKHSIRRTFRLQSRIGNHRVRKVMTSRYWKTTPGLKDCEKLDTTSSEGMNPFYRCRKTIYSRERFQQAPIKKRRLSDHRLTVTYDCQDNSNSISNIPGKAANGTSANLKVHSKSNEHQVAVSIKSFKVPELYIEVPESATLGSLKRTVLEAVTAILGRGIRVGIVLQGKNVRDDNRTLLQAGISQCSNLDNLSFTLEPSLAHISANPKPEPLSLLCDATHSDTQTSLATPVIGDSDITKQDSVANNELIPIDGAVPHNMALVPVSANAFAAVPLNQKPKRSKVAQRRTRRPFSVAEVEALVEAVEKLGTGRWRDVKIRAFENADHRTYVDLKDKWKTLVHTASISPQQRRGEPVPHELLNRVLSAHSHWSHHQSKHGKLQAIEPPRIMDSQEASVGA